MNVAAKNRDSVLKKERSRILMAALFALFAGDPVRGNTPNGTLLILSMPNSPSHFRSFEPFLTDLAEKGHNVTIISHDIFRKSVNSKDSKFRTTYLYVEPRSSLVTEPFIHKNDTRFRTNFWGLKQNPLNFIYPWRVWTAICEDYLDQVDGKLPDYQGDLAIIDETFNPCMYGVARRMRETQKSSRYAMALTTMMFRGVAVHYQLAINPALLTTCTHQGEYDASNFHHRLISTVEFIAELYVYGIAGNLLSSNTARRIDPTFPGYPTFIREAEAFFVDYPEVLEFPRPRTLSLIEGGSWCPHSNGNLSDEIRTFVEEPSSAGTIYVAFGTHGIWDFAPPGTLTHFTSAMRSLEKYRFVWSYKGTKLPEIPPNVLVVPWVQQLEMLQHPRTKVFFSHGGLKSIREGLCSARPMVVLPFIVEQPRNAWILSQKGVGVVLDKTKISAETIRNALETILSNDSYARNAEKLSEFMDDVPITGDRNRVFWTEFMLRHRGMPSRFFKNHPGSVGFLDGFCFDAVVFLLTVCSSLRLIK